METKSKRSFVQSWLPWVVAAGALVLYGVLLNRTITVTSLPMLSRAAGWEWRPVYTGPLYFLATWPVRWLPHGWQLIGLNLFGALCSALSLALLARSVALLPHDRTRDQRALETSDHSFLSIPLAWLPPVFAVLVGGLQITFWEQSVVATGESLSLLVFAYGVRCLLEYRVEQEESWMCKAALAFGMGAANHWLVLGLCPAMLVAVVWMMGLRIFKLQFLVRFALCGLAGLSLYLLLPLVQNHSVIAQSSVWQGLKTNLAEQKLYLTAFPRYAIILLAVSSVVPVFVMGIRWANTTGDISAHGYRANNLMTHVIHLIFLAACAYVAFDMAVSPHSLGYGLPFLQLYYLSALSGGYFIGYFLLVFGGDGGRSRRRTSPAQPYIKMAVTVLASATLLLVPARLVYKNIGHIRAINSPDLDRYAAQLAAALPATGAIVLSDDPIRLHAVRTVLGGAAAQKFTLLDTSSLENAAYHRHLNLKYPGRLPPINPAALNAAGLQQMLGTLEAKSDLYYLHPSFGYYFENFYAQPLGLVCQLRPYPANAVEAPLPTAREIAENDARWKKIDAEALSPFKDRVTPAAKKQDTQPDQLWVGRFYSRALNVWGVELQRAGLFDQADKYFEQALAANPDNPAAFINHEFNRHWVKTHKLLDRFSEEAMGKIMPYAGNWDLVASLNGPIDEPVFASDYANACIRGGILRQAAQAMTRALSYSPDDVPVKITLANVYTHNHWPDRALALISEIRSKTPAAGLEPDIQLRLILAEASAHHVQGDKAGAETLLQAAQEKFPKQEGAFALSSQFHLMKADELRTAGKRMESLTEITNVLRILERQIQLQPDSISTLITYGGLRIHLEDYAGSLPALNRVLDKLDPKNTAALANRALAYLSLKRYDEAKRDYENLANYNSSMFRAYYGLAEIAWQQKNRRDAMDNYERYLKHALASTAESKLVRERVEKLKKNQAF